MDSLSDWANRIGENVQCTLSRTVIQQSLPRKCLTERLNCGQAEEMRHATWKQDHLRRNCPVGAAAAFSFSDNFINRVRIHSPSPPWHRKPWLGNGHPSHKGVSVHTGFSANPGGPVWERYSGTVLIDLELVWSFTFYLHIPRRPFLDAGNWLWKQKSRSPCYGRTADNRELEASALFENEKSRDSYGFTPQKSRQV